MAKKQEDDGKKIIAKNRKAFHDFTIIEQVEAGIVLTGSEVKSLRDGKVVLDESYARIQDGEAQLLGVSIPTVSRSSITWAKAGLRSWYCRARRRRLRRCLFLHRAGNSTIVVGREFDVLLKLEVRECFKRNEASNICGRRSRRINDKSTGAVIVSRDAAACRRQGYKNSKNDGSD